MNSVGSMMCYKLIRQNLIDKAAALFLRILPLSHLMYI
jgi:hypothetical protein